MALCGKVRMSERTRSVALNALGAYGVKGASLLVSFFTLPAYIAYFGDQVALGVWYALLSIINWFNLFDFGIGNGLRNSLTRALATGDMQGGKTAVSSAYASAGIIAICVCAALLMAEGLVPWGELLRVDAAVVGEGVLVLSVRIVTVGIMARIVLGLATSVLYAMQRSALVNACSRVERDDARLRCPVQESRFGGGGPRHPLGRPRRRHKRACDHPYPDRVSRAAQLPSLASLRSA